MSSKTATSTSPNDPVAQLSSLVDPSEIISASSSDYIDNTQPWSANKDEHPRLVLRPKSISALSKAVACLAKSDLDFTVRSQGFGSASAKDVLISLTAFDQFDWDEKNKIVTLGPGGNWQGYYERMAKAAPGWTIVSARTPCIGIGGSTLASGFSWLSHEYGCISDPANMLDAQVVKLDGSIVWASTEPDLLWALRGTGGGFGIVTAFKFQARPYPEGGKIWAGPIFIPRDKAPEVAKGILSMAKAEVHPKTAMFLYVMRKELLYLIGATQDVLVMHCHDGRGEEAGRKMFQWALHIEGAVDQTRGNCTQQEIANMQAQFSEFRGTTTTYSSALALSELDEVTILKSFAWWDSILHYPHSLSENGWLLFELFSCRDSLTGRHSSAWPRPPGYKHMVLLGAGCAKDANAEEAEEARQKLIDAPVEIFGADKAKGITFVPNAIEDFHDIKVVYGEHYEKLREIKRKYDPENRLKGHFKP